MKLSLFPLVLVGFAHVADAQTKSPRPNPDLNSTKPVPDHVDPVALPGAPIRNSSSPAASKPLPPGAPRPESLTFTRPDVMVDEPGDGRVWVRGVGYKASFGADGAVIIPFLGSDAPTNHPVRMSIASARAGDRDIALASTVTLHHDDRHIVIDRGGVSEVYDVTRDGMEQTFVLATLPNRAALHLEIAIESDLVAREIGDGIELSNERGGVRCGNTTVIDADGARVQMPTRLVDGRMHVDVPESFVRNARLPLRVDPTWTTYQIVTAPLDQYFSDVAYDASWGNWCIVYEDAYSLADHDVYAVMVYSNQILAGQTTSIDYTTDSWHEPKVANNSLADNFLVVGNVWDFNSGNPVTKGRIRDAGTVSMGAQTVLSGPDMGNKIAADVGGDPVTVGPTYYLVVYERIFNGVDTDIHARLVSSAGVPIGATILIDDTSFTLDEAPRISKSDGNPPYDTQEWNIVWQRTDSMSGLHDVRGAQVHWDGSVTTPSFVVDGGATDDTNPVASPPQERPVGLRPWMAAWERDMGAEHDIVGQVLEGGVTTASANLTALEGISTTEDQLGPELECDGLQFVMTFRESYGTPLDYDIYASALWYADNTIGVSEGHAMLDFTSQNSHLPRIASQNSGGVALGGAFVSTWTTLSASGNFDIYAGQYFPPPNGPTPQPYCFGDGSGTACPCAAGLTGNGCPNSVNGSGANITSTGFHIAIADSLMLTASGLPTTATCLFFQGTAPANSGAGVVFGDGLRCVGGTVTRLAQKTAQGGVASYPEQGDLQITVKGGIGQPGGLRYYQAWYRNAAAFCTPSTFNLTNGLGVVWLP